MSSICPRQCAFRAAESCGLSLRWWRGLAALWMLTALIVSLAACGGSPSASAPPSPAILVSVQPASASLLLGEPQQFMAMVTGTSDSAVNWSVNGIPGGNSTIGTVSPNGLYTAPPVVPSPASVTVSTASQQDPSATGSASVQIGSDIVVTLSPNAASLAPGTTQNFTAGVTSSGDPDPSVSWSVNGVAGGNATVGTVASTGADSGTYTAPASPPSPPSVNLVATSVADPSKSATVSITISCGTANSISPSTASVPLGANQSFTAVLCVAPGEAVAWDVNGIAGGNANLGTIAAAGSSAVYTAPNAIPSPNPVTLHAVAGSQSASAAVTIVSGISVSLSPASASVPVNQRATFTVTVTGASNQEVTWSVDGVANGNTTVGQVCATGSNPCLPPSTNDTRVDYLAPSSVPSPSAVTLTAASQIAPSQSASATITITASSTAISVSISPAYAFLGPEGQPGSTMQFSASVSGTTNQSVTWSLASGVPGQGCTGAACGTIDSNGLYAAPASAPSPNAISVIATSVADPTKSASAAIALTSGPVIETILPSSVIAGPASSFTLAVQGLNFIAGNGSGASEILVNGSPRSTSCPTPERCTTPLNPPDAPAAGSLAVQIENPGSPPGLSNPVSVVIVPPSTSPDVISLSASFPVAAGRDILAVEPTTAGTTPSAINVDFVGMVSADGSSCSIQGSPLSVTRPASGTTVVSICVHGNSLDPTFTYSFSGPNPSDIGVTASSMAGLFPNLIELTLTLSAETLPGVRTLFISTPNHDVGVATGMLEVN